MAKKTLDKLREKRKEELMKDLLGEERRLQGLQFDLARGKVKNSADVRYAKRNIARIKTLMREKEKETQNTENAGK